MMCTGAGLVIHLCVSAEEVVAEVIAKEKTKLEHEDEAAQRLIGAMLY